MSVEVGSEEAGRQCWIFPLGEFFACRLNATRSTRGEQLEPGGFAFSHQHISITLIAAALEPPAKPPCPKLLASESIALAAVPTPETHPESTTHTWCGVSWFFIVVTVAGTSAGSGAVARGTHSISSRHDLLPSSVNTKIAGYLPTGFRLANAAKSPLRLEDPVKALGHFSRDADHSRSQKPRVRAKLTNEIEHLSVVTTDETQETSHAVIPC